MSTDPVNPDELGYEAARAELESIVQRLESGTANLAETMELWERGEQLAGRCQRMLDEARSKIEASRPADSTPSQT